MELVRPAERYQASYVRAIGEYRAEGRDIGSDFELAEKNFPTFVHELNERAEGKHLPKGYVPETLYWLVDGDTYIGQVSIRHTLTEHLRQIGGHIGYNIRPSKRRLGYGTAILQLALLRAKELGIVRALVTCDETNVGSRKIIERAGGVLENKVPQEGLPDKLRFWIDLN